MTKMMDAEGLAPHNWNMFASSLLIDACVRFGSDTFFVSPGYRDAPFIAALSRDSRVQLVSCFDERAAGYQALGWAKSSGKPAVLICTSGTAGANYLPAVIEARIDHVPLLVITADRPFELVHATAQQVIDQRELYGRFVKKSLNFPAPSPSLKSAAWISYAKMLLELSTEDRPGPVHINLPFNAPLDPVETSDRPSAEQIQAAEAGLERMRFSDLSRVKSRWDEALRQDFLGDLAKARRGLLIFGRCDSQEERDELRALRDRLGWVVFADVGSGLKFESEDEIPDLTIPESRRLIDAYQPDCVLHVGKRLVSRHFDDALARLRPEAYWVLSEEEQVQDPYHLPERRQHRIDESVLRLASGGAPEGDWKAKFRRLNERLRQLPSPCFNFRDVAEVLRESATTPIFLGNSTAIRAFDSWCFGTSRRLAFEANRGVSGIEGLLATTIGLSLGTRSLWTLVIGDISLLHDLNSIISLAQSEASVLIVLVNNVGGRIFETLPVQQYAWVKDPLISTPHEFVFEGVAAMAGLPYVACATREDLARAFAERQRLGGSCIIECRQDAEADLNFVRAIKAQEHEYE